MNPFMGEIFSISTSYENEKARKKDTSEEMSYLVDQTLRISNLAIIEGLVLLQRFIEECQPSLPAPG